VPHKDAKAELTEARAAFRARVEKADAEGVWRAFPGRIAVALSGGGARGAYEVGALLAFQDARLPSHIITATSVGSINAASYVGHSEKFVGNAERLAQIWYGLIPPAVGIEWTSYAWRLAGLVAASAGFGNLLRHQLVPEGFDRYLHNPTLTWFTLGLAGLALLLLYDYMPYVGYLVRNYFRRGSWQPDRRKAMLSTLANVIVWGFFIGVFSSLHVLSRLPGLFFNHPVVVVLFAVVVMLLVWLRNLWSAPWSSFLHKLLRSPLRSGLFSNFERSRLVRGRVSNEQLRASPIRLLITATDLQTGTARYFANAPPTDLAADPGADAGFVAEEVTTFDDLIGAVIASSAMPIVYEPMPLAGRIYADGGIVANQPIRPALRLGADALFLVMVNARQSEPLEAKTFIDVGLRSLSILMDQSLSTDLKLLNNVNTLCEQAAQELGLRPEEIEIDFGTRRYRYVRAFAIRPAQPLGGTELDFGGGSTGPAMLQGYRDACAEIESFLAYAPQAKFGRTKRVLRYLAG
jgi:predicted acylesterase/phospholipase RssA